MTPILCFWAIIPLSNKTKKSLTYSLNWGILEPHPIYRRVFTIVFPKTLHTFLQKAKKSLASSVNWDVPLIAHTGAPPHISSEIGVHYNSVHQNDTYIFADITPILCFWAIIPLSSKNQKKSYILCKCGYTLNSGAPPPHISS